MTRENVPLETLQTHAPQRGNFHIFCDLEETCRRTSYPFPCNETSLNTNHYSFCALMKDREIYSSFLDPTSCWLWVLLVWSHWPPSALRNVLISAHRSSEFLLLNQELLQLSHLLFFNHVPWLVKKKVTDLKKSESSAEWLIVLESIVLLRLYICSRQTQSCRKWRDIVCLRRTNKLYYFQLLISSDFPEGGCLLKLFSALIDTSCLQFDGGKVRAHALNLAPCGWGWRFLLIHSNFLMKAWPTLSSEVKCPHVCKHSW